MRVLDYDPRRHDLAGTKRGMLGVSDLSGLRADATPRHGVSAY